MVSLAVGPVEGHGEWHLPTYDPRNENKYHYKLHSLDIYFWTQKDALSFVNGIRRVLPANQVDVQDEPGPPQHQLPPEVSHVVQKLENVAISDNTNMSIPPPPPPQNNAANPSNMSFAPPPLSAVSAGHDNDGPDSAISPASFVPMAYNPAAPAAPEQIQHREKTPPPEDGSLDPLHARLIQDAGTPFSPGLASNMPSGLGPLSPGIPPPQFHAPPGAPSFPGPPVGTPGMPPQGFGTHPGLQRAATMPVHAGMQSPGLQSPFSAASHAQQFPIVTSTPSYVPGQLPPQHTPTPPLASPGLASPPAAPPAGYSNYSYTAQQGGGHNTGEYAIHHQAYRPTEGEHTVKYATKKEVRGRFEENAGRIEKGVTGMLKRFEKKFG